MPPHLGRCGRSLRVDEDPGRRGVRDPPPVIARLFPALMRSAYGIARAPEVSIRARFSLGLALAALLSSVTVIDARQGNARRDLQGLWTNGTATPLPAAAKIGRQPFFTPSEAAEYRANRDPAPGQWHSSGGSAGA